MGDVLGEPLCVHCGETERNCSSPQFFEPQTDGVISMTPWEDLVEAANVFTAEPWNARMRRVFNDTVQWRLIALVADVVVLWLFVGDALQVGAAAIFLFGLKTVLFALWRMWREAQLAN